MRYRAKTESRQDIIVEPDAEWLLTTPTSGCGMAFNNDKDILTSQQWLTEVKCKICHGPSGVTPDPKDSGELPGNVARHGMRRSMAFSTNLPILGNHTCSLEPFRSSKYWMTLVIKCKYFALQTFLKTIPDPRKRILCSYSNESSFFIR